MKKNMPEEVQKMLNRLGKAVKSARLARNEKQTEVTKATGLSQNIVTNMETGQGSAVSSLLVVLRHLDLLEDVIATIEMNTESTGKARQRVTPVKKPRVPKAVSTEKLESRVTEQELMRGEDEVVDLSVALKDDELMPALKERPDNIYRINKNLAMKLAGDPTSNTALLTHTVRYKTPAGSARQHEVYYATTLQGASKANDITWTVGGFLRKQNAVLDAVISLEDESMEKARKNADKFLALLRREFSQYKIFIDAIKILNTDQGLPSHLRKGNREVRGEKYKEMYGNLLTGWLESIK